MRALVTGATGFIGRALVAQLKKPVVLTRDPGRAKALLGDVEAHAWADPAHEPPPAAALAGIDAVFHLAGDNVAQGRWSDAKKERIRSSRVGPTEKLVAALVALEAKPKVLVSASAVGFYGSRDDELLTETSSQGEDFLGGVCGEWEKATGPAGRKGIRTVNARIGVVMGKGGGAYAKMLLPFKLGLGGRLGSGEQWTSWVHLADVVGLLLHAAKTESLSGPLNVVAPTPVTNDELARAMGRSLRRPALLPAPALALRVAMGEMADGLLLASQRASAAKAISSGYAFRYPTIDAALAELAGSGSTSSAA